MQAFQVQPAAAAVAAAGGERGQGRSGTPSRAARIASLYAAAAGTASSYTHLPPCRARGRSSGWPEEEVQNLQRRWERLKRTQRQ